MDHIATPQNPFNHRPVRIPYLPPTQDEIKRLNFDLFFRPLNQSFNPTEGDLSSLVGRRTAISRLQWWCFFGLIMEVTRLAEVSVAVHDFVTTDEATGNRFITTEKLPLVMRAIHLNSRALENTQRRAVQKGIIEALRTTQSYINQLGYSENYLGQLKPGSFAQKLEGFPESVTAEEIHLAILILIENFSACIILYANIQSWGFRKSFLKSYRSTIPFVIALFMATPNYFLVWLSEFWYRAILWGIIVVISLSALMNILLPFLVPFASDWENLDIEPLQLLEDSCASQYLFRRMNDAGWCPTEAFSVTQKFSPSALHFMSCMDRTFLGRNHEICPRNQERPDFPCEYDKGKFLNASLPRHSTPICECQSDREFRKRHNPAISSVISILEKGCTPTISVADTEVQSIQVYRSTEKPYVCISHAWSDGLGNENYNNLPRCQILRIQRYVNALYPVEIHPIPFWIDTVCIPCGNSINERNLRKSCIRSMRDIYHSADKVLVLDNVLTGIPVSSTPNDLTVRIASTTWKGRLWTFQEGLLNNCINYQFLGGAVTLSQILERRIKEPREKFLTCNQSYIGGYLTFAGFLQALVANRLRHITLLPENPLYPLCLCEDVVFTLFHKINSRRENFESLRIEDDCQKWGFLVSNLGWRTTSKPEDETLCLAGILNQNVEYLLVHPHELQAQQLAIARMRLFRESLRSVPAGFLFLDLPRSEDNGWSWMPTTFLGRGGDAAPMTMIKATPTPNGLDVSLPGIIFGARANRIFIEPLNNSLYFQAGESYYRLNGYYKDWVNLRAYEDQDLALILARPLRSSDVWELQVNAALVSLQHRYTSVRLRVAAHFIKPGFVHRCDNQEVGFIRRNLSLECALELREEQTWLIS